MNKLSVDQRPKLIDEIVGHDLIKNSLKEFIEKSNSGAFLFAGERGVGKTTFSRVLENELGIKKLNLFEYTVSVEAKVDMAREIVDRIGMRPAVQGKRLFILNEIHQAKKMFQDILLEALENPPEGTFIVLCTTEPGRLQKTIKSRCISYLLKPLSKKESSVLLKRISKNIDFEIGKDIIREIYLKGEGIPREMINILEVCSKGLDDKSQIEYLNSQSGVSKESEVKNLCQYLLYKNNVSEAIKIADNINADPESIRWGVVTYCAYILKRSSNKEEMKQAAIIISFFSESYQYTGIAGLYLSIYNVLE